MRRKITKATVDALESGVVLADTELRGFVARRLPSGVVTYGLRYRAAGRQRWMALGIHGRVTPDQARKIAKQRIGEVAADRDPAGERQAARAKAAEAATNTVDTQQVETGSPGDFTGMSDAELDAQIAEGIEHIATHQANGRFTRN
jgi:hypothetical protein